MVDFNLLTPPMNEISPIKLKKIRINGHPSAVNVKRTSYLPAVPVEKYLSAFLKMEQAIFGCEFIKGLCGHWFKSL